MTDGSAVATAKPVWSCNECVRRWVDDPSMREHLVQDHGWEVSRREIQVPASLVKRCTYCKTADRWVGQET